MDARAMRAIAAGYREQSATFKDAIELCSNEQSKNICAEQSMIFSAHAAAYEHAATILEKQEFDI